MSDVLWVMFLPVLVVTAAFLYWFLRSAWRDRGEWRQIWHSWRAGR